MNCPEGKEFWCKNGRALRNINELRRALKTMSDEEYKHHVTSTKNDFANWVDHVFGKKKMAQKMRKAKNKQETIKSMEKKKVKQKTEIGIEDEKYKIMPEGAHPHINTAAHVALGIVIGSAITMLILLLL